MQTILIQLTAFLIITLTPVVNWVSIPLYTLMNICMAFASFLVVIVTSESADGQLKIDKSGLGWVVFQVWYCSNIVLAVPCLLVLIGMVVSFFSAPQLWNGQ